MDSSAFTSRIDVITQTFRQDFGGLSALQLNWKPSPEKWSIAQNIEHLIVINESYRSEIQQVLEKRYKMPWTGKFNFLVNFFGKTILNSVEPTRRKKMKTFPLWKPSQSEIGGDVVKRFEKSQAELKELIESSKDLLNQKAVISSPMNKNIVYRLETAFEIIVTHEERHFRQAKEVADLQKIK